jgi:hypothetical protein
MSKLRPTIFLEAARFIKRELKRYPNGKQNSGYTPACLALQKVVSTRSWEVLRRQPEYRLFYKEFSNKRDNSSWWFGSPNIITDYVNYRPKVANQKKRIRALLKCYKLAGGKRNYNLNKLGV